MNVKILNEHQIQFALWNISRGYTHQEIADALYVHKRTLERALQGRVPSVREKLKYDYRETIPNEGICPFCGAKMTGGDDKRPISGGDSDDS